MSLIHEALRKARREPDEEDARGVAYARGLTGRRRRHGIGTGILLGALAVSAGAAAGIGMWLWLGNRSVSGPPAPAAGSPAPAATTVALGPAEAHPTPAPTAGPMAPGPELPADRLPQPAGSSQPAEEPAPDAGPPASPAAAGHRPPPRGDTGRPGDERVFAVEADVGYARLVLDYIVARPTDPFARINGIDVRVGSTIEGFTVEEITSSAVRLRDARGPLTLGAR